MALAFSSGVYFEGMGLLLCNPVPSIKPRAIHTSEGGCLLIAATATTSSTGTGADAKPPPPTPNC